MLQEHIRGILGVEDLLVAKSSGQPDLLDPQSLNPQVPHLSDAGTVGYARSLCKPRPEVDPQVAGVGVDRQALWGPDLWLRSSPTKAFYSGIDRSFIHVE